MIYNLVIPSGIKNVDDFQKSIIGKFTNLYQNAGKPAMIQIESLAGGKTMKEDFVIFSTLRMGKEGTHSHNFEIYGCIKANNAPLDESASHRINGTVNFLNNKMMIG